MAVAKLCTDCVFYINNGLTKQHGSCSKEWKTAPQISPVTGEREKGTHYYAATQRSHGCGAEGHWWKSRIPQTEAVIVTDKQPKLTWWGRLVQRFV